MALNPWVMAWISAGEQANLPEHRRMGDDPRISCRHSRQSKEIDCVNCATRPPGCRQTVRCERQVKSSWGLNVPRGRRKASEKSESGRELLPGRSCKDFGTNPSL